MVLGTRKGRLALVVRPGVLEALEARRIYLRELAWALREPKHGSILFLPTTMVEPYCGVFAGDILPTIGAFSYSHSATSYKQRIGRFCSIGKGVVWTGAPQHDRLSTSWFASHPAGFLTAAAAADEGVRFEVEPPRGSSSVAVIEHDVWIGEGATVGEKITLRTGCVVNAGAVVTKDVAPYSIVAGNPAQVVGMRFPEHLVADLLASSWWNYRFTGFAGMAVHDPARFLGEFDEAREGGRLQLLPSARPFSEIAEEIEQELGGPA